LRIGFYKIRNRTALASAKNQALPRNLFFVFLVPIQLFFPRPPLYIFIPLLQFRPVSLLGAISFLLEVVSLFSSTEFFWKRAPIAGYTVPCIGGSFFFFDVMIFFFLSKVEPFPPYLKTLSILFFEVVFLPVGPESFDCKIGNIWRSFSFSRKADFPFFVSIAAPDYLFPPVFKIALHNSEIVTPF